MSDRATNDAKENSMTDDATGAEPGTDAPPLVAVKETRAELVAELVAELERNVNELESWGWAEAADMLRKRVAELRVG